MVIKKTEKPNENKPIDIDTKPIEEKPQTPTTNSQDKINSNVLGDTIDTTQPVKTNDSTMIMPYVILGLCALGAYIIIKKRDKRHA